MGIYAAGGEWRSAAARHRPMEMQSDAILQPARVVRTDRRGPAHFAASVENARLFGNSACPKTSGKGERAEFPDRGRRKTAFPMGRNG